MLKTLSQILLVRYLREKNGFVHPRSLGGGGGHCIEIRNIFQPLSCMSESLDWFDCKKGHQIKNVVFSIIINSNSEAFMNHKANSIYKKIMKKRNGQGLWP